MVDFPRCRLATWADAERWTDRLAEMIRGRDRVPDTIVALTRGGWVPTRLLADRLGVKRLVSLRAQHWGVTALPSGRAELTEGVSGPVEGRDVLVVDDITDTGESLRLATEHVEARGPRRVESATCLHITHSTFVPTYFAEEIPREAWVWVVFPWNYWEDVRTLVARAAQEGGDAFAVRDRLAERCALSVPIEHVALALERAVPTSASPAAAGSATSPA
jgi:hypoxanthine phosphoribosyltransferase